MKTIIIPITSLLALASSVAAHASMAYPCPRYSPHGENCPAFLKQLEDTNYNAPISTGTVMSQPLCKHTTPFATPSATWAAGQSVTVKFNPDVAAHGGGHGQFSISYDNGQTFAVVHEVLRYMFVGSKADVNANAASVLSYTFTLPADLPSSDKAVFAWTWVNAIGNREFYTNCADIAIKGGSSKSYTGKKMTIVNYPGYPPLAEFGGNYDTGIELYTNAQNITISPRGSSIQSGNQASASQTDSSNASGTCDDSDSQTTPMSVAPHAAVTTTMAANTAMSSAPAAAAASTISTAASYAQSGFQNFGDCIHGAMICDSASPGYKICMYGKWNPAVPCAAGTTCKSLGNSIICG